MLALDRQLAQLQSKASTRSELSLSIRRFQTFVGAVDPLLAISRAVASVLEAYPDEPACRGRISASALCVICGLTLEGEPTRGRTNRGFIGEGGHTGALVLSPERSRIQLPSGIGVMRGRVSVGHEIGHYLIHRRGTTIDTVTARLPTSMEEEALAEYAGRLLLMPRSYERVLASSNIALACLEQARQFDVTLHAATARLGDPDSHLQPSIRGVILWRMNPYISSSEPIAVRLSPHWHLCRDAFIPVRKCHAGRTSLIGELGAMGEETAVASRLERVEIGSLRGCYRVDAVAWGSSRRGTRTVLSVFVEPSA
jgi:hypothetical protein